MANEIDNLGSAGQAGSPTNVPPNANGGQTGNSGEPDYKALYEELNTKLGTQGQELGDYRKFFNQITPVLEKLDAQPDLIKAIVDGKVDAKLVQAALEGKIKIEDAAAIQQAHNQVKKDLGKEYDNTSPEALEKLLEEKLGILEKKFDEKESMRDFEKKTSDFIASKPDFEKYADAVTEWFKDHPENDDIATAYYAVVGQALEKAQREGDTEKAAEIAKAFALNASGGSSGGAQAKSQEEVVDMLISKQGNMNLL